MVVRVLAFLYWVIVYAFFLVTIVWFAGFISNRYVMSTIDSGLQIPRAEAVGADIVLLALFGLQHSLMARSWWKRLLPWPIERTTYMLASSMALAALYRFWEPIPALVWHVENDWWIRLIALGGAILVAWSSAAMDHWDTFGFKQAWAFLRSHPYLPPPFRTPGPYRWSRHPMMLGVLVLLWATPEMSQGHLLFSAVLSFYVMLATVFEERDLNRRYPDVYPHYRSQVRRWV